MDRLESLGSTLSNLTMYDIKSMYNQAKNVVLNVSEMEAKVREATNDDPWGASSTLMQDIAQGAWQAALLKAIASQNFNEIMPCIYAQFMEKEARQWRQIYKALQLLEYLVKNGSERVIDDARSHISTIKMLRSFHYIDDKGKDQGINVRNRSREIVELLSDVEKIRQERRKAKANRSKYIGTGSDGMSFSSAGARYGGFGSDSLGSSSFGTYGGGGGGYGERASGMDREYNNSGGSGGFRDEGSRKGYEEYDAGEYEEGPRRSDSTSRQTTAASTSRSSTLTTSRSAPAKAPEPVKEVDLLGGFGDDEPVAAPAKAEKALPALTALNVSTDADDEFADFQAAPPSAPATKPNLMDILNASTPAPARSAHASRSSIASPVQTPSYNAFPAMTAQARPTSYVASPPPTTASPSLFSQAPLAPTPSAKSPPPRMGVASPSSTTSAKPASNFDDLWSMSLGSSGSKPATPTGAPKSIKDLANEKAQAGIWGASKAPAGQAQRPGMGGSFGSFAGPAVSSASAGGADDLLL